MNPGQEEIREIIKVLIKRLIDKGMDTEEIPHFVGRVARTIFAGGHTAFDRKAFPPRLYAFSGLDEEIIDLATACVFLFSCVIPDHINSGRSK